ncbi:MAG: hypothetical protein A2514_10755 [Gammaproteobacteria bacterium RIFOXYD12_FULL_61_37]|nr:MAG: hypothetical protein A2514_10755 [Gammaproteobacteria bacterium RIFOXYD12_FULL_61_37]
MKRLADQIKQALAALAYADLGERSGRGAMYEALYPDDLSAIGPAVAPRRLIALGVGETLPGPVMNYAIGACRRMQAGLLFLTADAMRVRELLAEYLPELQGIECLTEELTGTSASAVLHALNLRGGVLFAVTGTDDDPLRVLLRAKRGQRSPVPIVLVGPKAPRQAAALRLERSNP